MIRHPAVLDAVRDAIFLTDVETGMIVDANRAAESLCGWSAAELRSLHHTQLHRPEEAEAASLGFSKISQEAGLSEDTLLHRDGRRIPVEISASHFTTPEGRRILIGVVRDITERNAAKEHLRRSVERFQQVAENADAFIWEVDAAGLYLYASPAVERILGYTPEEIVGKKHFYDLFTENTREDVRKAAFEAFSRREPFRAFLNWNVKKDGSIVALETSGVPVRDATGAFLGYRGVDADVTERKRAEEALRQSEKIYRAIGESIDYGVWVCAPDGRNTYASESFLKLVGLTQEQCSSFGWGDVLHPDDADRTIAAWKECVRTQGRWDAEHRFRGADGGWHAVLARGVPVHDEQGQITCWAGISLDISALKRTQEFLRESESDARARAAELQAIMDAAPAVIVIAHDAECRHISGNRTAYLLLRQQPGSNLSQSAPESERPANIRYLREGTEIPPRELPMQIAASSGQAVRNCELQVVFEDGTSIDLLGNVEPMLDDNGRPRGAVAVLSDITERKQAEAALRESEERFRNMADTAPVMIWVAGADKGCTFFNKPWLDFTGRTMEQEKGDGWTGGVHPEDLSRCLATYSTSFEARRSFQMEYRLRHADGTYRWIVDTGLPRYREGEFTGYIGSCMDVTGRREMEERLLANEVRLMDAQRLAKVGSWELEPEGGRNHWSEEMFRIVGLPHDERPDFATFLSYVHPRDRELILDAQDKALSGTAPVGIEYRIIRPDGDVRFVRSIVEAVENGQQGRVRLAGATQDITDEIRAREFVRESEERLRNAERIAQVGNWRWDINGNRVFWSEELYRIFGNPQNCAPSYEQFIQMVVPEDREQVDRWVQDCFAGRSNKSLEFQIARPCGDLRTVNCIIEVSRDEEGVPVHMSGTCQDVTDSRRAQAEAFARQNLESVGTLASGIAHDFNNLLGGVVAVAELAVAELDAGMRPTQEVKQIRDVAMQGAEIVRQLMIYAGKESEVPELLNVSRIVTEMLDLLKVSVSKHAVLETDLGRDLPAVRANAAQLRRIVMNLVMNASEAIGDRDGVIRVATRHVITGASEATSKGLREGDYLELEVSDNGAGMPPETQARVLDPFFTTRSAGRGLGLAVVHGIVRNLHGAIDLASQPGKGTTFRIMIPSVETGPRETAGPIPPEEEVVPLSHEGTVLVVEDENLLRRAVARQLRRRGFEVLEAADGSAATDLLREQGGKIDAILLDLTIPGRSSQEVVVEAAQARPDLKVIVTSAYSEEMVTAALSSPLIRAFVRKPFRLENLAETLRNVISSSTSTADSA
jgi:PAS domain S-box-containing protein